MRKFAARINLVSWLFWGPFLGLCLGLVSCSDPPARNRSGTTPAPTPSPTAKPQVTPRPTSARVSIIGTSDLHGRIAALPRLGGFLSIVRAKRAVVLVDAGDMFQGTLESNLAEGAPVIDAYRTLGYDAMAIGNHEFDYGPVGERATADLAKGEDPRGALRARAVQARGKFAFLDANLVEGAGPPKWDNVQSSVLIERGGAQVGVIGVTTEATPRTTMAANFAGLAVTPLAEAIAREAAALRKRGAQVVVVAAHAGGDCKQLDAPDDLTSCRDDEEIFQVARALPPGAVDVIVAGHTHQAVAHRVGGIAIVQSWANGRGFGRVDVDLEGGKVTAVTIHPPQEISAQSYDGEAVSPLAAVEADLQPALAQAATVRERAVANLGDAFKRAYDQESALGNLVATMMLEADAANNSDIAITNGGGLRADLPLGILSYGNLYNALPFDNRFAHVTMTGRELRALVKRNLGGSHGILSLAGVTVRARCGKQGLELEMTATPAKRKPYAIKDDDQLLIVTSDFLATGGDDFGKTGTVTIDDSSPPLREAVVDALGKRQTVLWPSDFFRPKQRRIVYPGKRPVRCP